MVGKYRLHCPLIYRCFRYILYIYSTHNDWRYGCRGWWKDIGLSKLMILLRPTKVVFGSCRTSANIPFGRFITAPVSVLWRPILKFSPHLADYSSKNQFPRKSSRTRECRGHVIFLHGYTVEQTNPVFFFSSSLPFFFTASIIRLGCTKEERIRTRRKNFPSRGGRRGENEIFA